MTDAEYTKLLKKYHKLSERHVLVVETDMPYPDVLKVAALSDKIRKAGNELVGLMRKKLPTPISNGGLTAAAPPQCAKSARGGDPTPKKQYR